MTILSKDDWILTEKELLSQRVQLTLQVELNIAALEMVAKKIKELEK